jgi:hypothetical protein
MTALRGGLDRSCDGVEGLAWPRLIRYDTSLYILESHTQAQEVE